MKKLLSLACASLSVLALAACGGYSAKVLKLEDENKVVAAAGAHEVMVNGEWVANAWEIDAEGKNKMTATSVKEVSELDKDLAKTLSKRKLKYLYKTEIRVGVADAGWTTRCMLPDGKVYIANGSYTIKAIFGTKDAETGQYTNDQWVSDPKTAHVESLTPSTVFLPTWTEEKDENGFAWDQNPVCIGGAGIYTFIVAQYKTVSTADTCGFGFALVLKEKAEEGLAYKEEVKFSDNTYGIIGSFESSAWTTDLAMTKVDDDTFEGTVTLAVGDEWKIRANGEWATSYGYADLESAPAGAFEDNGGNFKTLVAGTYKVTLKSTGKITVVAAA